MAMAALPSLSRAEEDKDFNKWIELAEKGSITKQEAAKRMEMSQPAYLRYESGQRIPSIHVIYVMADVLGTSAEYLLGQTDNHNPKRYVVDIEHDSILFEMVKSYKEADNDAKSRLLAYIKKFAE